MSLGDLPEPDGRCFGEVGSLQPVTRLEFSGRSMGVGFRVAEGRHVTPKPSTSRQYYAVRA